MSCIDETSPTRLSQTILNRLLGRVLKREGGSKRAAFTLAEVLITLGIIGVVAALTLPVLVANYKEKVIITRAKKDYSLIMQALQLAQADYGTPNDNSSLFLSGTNDNAVMSNFSKYFPNSRLCLSSSKDKACTDLKHKILYSKYTSKYETISLPAIILPDGASVHLSVAEPKCVDTLTSGASLDADGNMQYDDDGNAIMWTDIRNHCGYITFDVNGSQEPNKYGYDAFKLAVFTDKIGAGYWNVFGYSSLASILSGGKLIYNNN